MSFHCTVVPTFSLLHSKSAAYIFTGILRINSFRILLFLDAGKSRVRLGFRLPTFGEFCLLTRYPCRVISPAKRPGVFSTEARKQSGNLSKEGNFFFYRSLAIKVKRGRTETSFPERREGNPERRCDSERI